MEGGKCHSLYILLTDVLHNFVTQMFIMGLFRLTVPGYDLQLHPLLSLQRGSIRGVRGTVHGTEGIGDVRHQLVLLTVKISVLL